MKTKIKLLMMLLVLSASCSIIDDGIKNEDENNQNQDEKTYTVNDLKGKWLRTGGNNTHNNGMIIKVEDKEGIVEEPVESNFPVGSVKWKDIKLENTNFVYFELGSDNNYYDATLKFETDDKIKLSVNAAGPGNYQIWERQ